MRERLGITLVTPSLNQGRFIEATIQSVLRQDYPHLEYIVMDGGSTDGTLEIIERYADRLAHWESHRDAGQADAVWRGLQMGSGQILGFLNSDDLLLPGSLEKVSRYFASHPEEEWVVGSTVLIGPQGVPLRNRLGEPICNLGARVSFHRLLFWGCGFYQPACFWRRASLIAAGGFDRSLQFCFDYDLYLRLAQRRASGSMDEFLACFRRHDASKSATLLGTWAAESEALWRKHGRYRRSKAYRHLAYLGHSLANRVRYRTTQLRLLVRLPRPPQPADSGPAEQGGVAGERPVTDRTVVFTTRKE